MPVLLLRWSRILSDGESNEQRIATDVDLDWELRVEDEYRSYVRPKWRPKLSDFCKSLTGIQQSDINSAPTFPEMLQDLHDNFILKHNLFQPSNKTIWVTDGPWDLRDFIAKASHINKTPRPSWLGGPIIDLRMSTALFFTSVTPRPSRNRQGSPPLEILVPPIDPDTELVIATPPSPPRTPPPDIDSDLLDNESSHTSPKLCPSTTSLTPSASLPPSTLPSSSLKRPTSLSIVSVLASLDLPPFIGNQHSGIDDSRNIARIVIELARRKWLLISNRVVAQNGVEKTWPWMIKGGGVAWRDPGKRVSPVRKRKSDPVRR